LEKPIDCPKAYAKHKFGSRRSYKPIIINALQIGNGRCSFEEEGSEGNIS